MNARFWVAESTPIESQAYDQIRNIGSLPILSGPVAVMPDVHLGKGATVGSVIPTRGAIIPAAVGVDLGCGLVAAKLNITQEKLPDNLHEMRSAIEGKVPVGFNWHKSERTLDNVLRVGTRQMFSPYIRAAREKFSELSMVKSLSRNSRDHLNGVAWKQIGTLGGGNHFLELQVDELGNVWLMLHSGSRNVGKTLAEVAIGEARKEAESRGDKLPDKDLAWLAEGSESFNGYMEALMWAQDYALLNREALMALMWIAVRDYLPEGTGVVQSINCHHNYVENMEINGESILVTRKGAVSAREGELGVIPGSMGSSSYIVEGLGNPDSYYSCSHGAGRLMSRNVAKKTFTIEDLEEQTAGVESRKDGGVIDEIPGAYKNIEAVMEAQKDLVKPVHKLKQLLCVKG